MRLLELPGVDLKHGAAEGDAGTARKRGRSGAAEGDASTARKRGRKRHDDAAGDAEKAAITAREPSPAKTPFHGFIS